MLRGAQLEPDGAALLIDEAQLGHWPRVGLASQAVWGPVDRVMSHQVALRYHDRPRVLAAPRVLGGIKLRARHAAVWSVRDHGGATPAFERAVLAHCLVVVESV
eukprot:scaffold2707_cov55-Phaeocystis_antarctica.AAC.7